MTVWVLFIWFTAAQPTAVFSYHTKAECDEGGDRYKRYSCVKVVVPNTQR